MDNRLIDDLAQAERHIAEGRETIARQEQIVAELDRDGHDTSAAWALLRAFRNSMEQHLDHRNRLLAQLGLERP